MTSTLPRAGLRTPAIDYAAIGLALLTFCLHALLAGRYDTFRDELYFIVCGRHPAFGYADQPPLVPLLSAGLYALGHNIWLLRLPVTISAAALVWVTARFARLLSGDTFAAVLAGLAAMIAPMLMGMAATFTTTAFDPLAWTLIAYFLVKAIKTEDRTALIWCGIIAGIDFEAKYSLVFWAISLIIGLILTPQRALFQRRDLWLGAAIAVLVGLPSVIWQATHNWPFLELAAAAHDKNAPTTPLAFLINQLLIMNPFLAPIWIAGIVAPFLITALRPIRFLSLAFVICLLLTLLTQGKDYYIAATYPAMFAMGAVAWSHWARGPKVRATLAGWLSLAVAFSAAISPVALPVLSVADLRTYMEHMPLKPHQQEKSFAGTLLPQLFADQLGWRDFTDQVGTAWQKIPASERAKTAIKTDNYGEAAALDVYGAPYGLPPALSGHNQYYFWGPRGQKPTNLLVVQNHPERLYPYCEHTIIYRTTLSPDAMNSENGKVIAFCQGLKVDMVTFWPELKHMD
jgi:4-amino-4-deoxy-L-arabinose transferase-like glycosyltransferase